MTRTQTRPEMRASVRTMALSLGVAIALWFLGRGALATPPVESWAQFHDWLGERSTGAAAIAALRATGAVVALYVGAVSALSIIAEVTSFVALGRVARSLVPRSLRPLVGVALGAGVATAAASLAVPRTSAPTQIATLVLDPPSDATATMYLVSDPAPAPSLASLAATANAIETPRDLIVDTTPAPVAAPEMPSPVIAPRTWTIERGDHLWAVAHETLADSWHRSPTDAEVVPYWRELIERNRSRLVDPSNPDYVLAGQVFELPTVPVGGRSL
jgi:nucleoid-associated protein YgaU